MRASRLAIRGARFPSGPTRQAQAVVIERVPASIGGHVLLGRLEESLEAGPLDLMAAIQFDTMTAPSREKPHRLAIDMERNSPQQGVSSDPLDGLEVLPTLGLPAGLPDWPI